LSKIINGEIEIGIILGYGKGRNQTFRGLLKRGKMQVFAVFFTAERAERAER
jgi:hypothetical protein